MDAARLLEVRDGVQSDHLRGESPGPRLCRTIARFLQMNGVGIMLRGDDGRGSSFGRSDEIAGRLEDLQFTLGEGPGIEAHTSGRPVHEPDLARSALWTVFGPSAETAGVLAAFGFPLRVGVIRLGALDLYRDRPGPLTDAQTIDAGVLAGVVTDSLLALEAQAGLDAIPRELDYGENMRAQVHQASGMLSEQLDIPIAEALVRLRARAYADGCPISAVAADVVAGTLKIT